MEITLKVADDFDEADPVPLASFSNGQVNNNATDGMRIALMRRPGERNPRKRVLVGETDRVTYLGANYETEGSLYTPPYCKYLVGSLNKETGVMTLHKADVYQMVPRVKGVGSSSHDMTTTSSEKPNKSQFTREDYTTTHDKMVQSFGSERAKRAWSAAKRNKIDSSILDSTLATALDYADSEMKKADNQEPKHVVLQTSALIPPHNASATCPEEAYQLSDIISDDVMSQLSAPAKTLVRATAQDISSWREKGSRTEFVLSQLSKLPPGVGAYKDASILVFCEYLINMYRLPTKEVEKNGLAKLWYASESVKQKLLSQYTEQGPRSSADTGVLTNRMRDKLIASLIILGLMVNGYSFDTTTLQRDLKVQSAKILEVSRALGCTANSGKTIKGQSKHYTVTLKIPLVFSTPSRGGRGKKGP